MASELLGSRVAALLVFFASLAGRMDSWLGSDGRGMMDAFNPAGHDIGVQSFGTLTKEDFETAIRQYSEITELDAPLLNTLIEKILVHEGKRGPDGIREQEVEIFYRFAGKIDI